MSHATVGSRLDGWREHMATQLTEGTLCQREQECLTSILQVLSNLRPYLVQCYDRKDFPRTVPRDGTQHPWTEARAPAASVAAKTGTRNGSRYGRSLAYYQWWEQDATRRQQLVELASRLDRSRWRELRRETTVAQHEQLTRFRFRNIRQAFLASLEERWAAAAPPQSLP